VAGTNPSAADPDAVVVGRLGRPHGLRGEFSVEMRTDVPERRFAAGVVLGCTSERFPHLTVVAARQHSGRWLVQFAEVVDRTGADAVRGSLLTIDASAVGPAGDDPDDEAWWDSELIGLSVVTTAGAVVGSVAEILHPPGGDLLAIRTEGGAEVLVPFVAELVPTVDVAGGRVVVDPPEGLLEL
jgi:16S rRNA processing protein RimM